MSIIGITGLKRSGKDTVAKYLCDNYGYEQYKFAGILKECGKLIFGWDDDWTEGSKKETVDPNFGISPRQFMQIFGTDIFQYRVGELIPEYKKVTGRKLWVNIFKKWYLENNKPNVVISDMRFPHEYECLKELDVKVIRVTKEGLDNTDLHESEKYALSLPADYIIENDYSIATLYTSVREIIKVI